MRYTWPVTLTWTPETQPPPTPSSSQTASSGMKCSIPMAVGFLLCFQSTSPMLLLAVSLFPSTASLHLPLDDLRRYLLVISRQITNTTTPEKFPAPLHKSNTTLSSSTYQVHLARILTIILNQLPKVSSCLFVFIVLSGGFWSVSMLTCIWSFL